MSNIFSSIIMLSLSKAVFRIRRWCTLVIALCVIVDLKYATADSTVDNVSSGSSPIRVEKIFVEKKTTNDLDTSASGYIYRSDGNGPPIYIKLGDDNIGQYEGVLKNSGIYSTNAKADISTPVDSSSVVRYPAKGKSSHSISNRYQAPTSINKVTGTSIVGDSEKYAYPIYKGKDEENFEFSNRQIEGGADIPAADVNIPIADEETNDEGYERQSPLTYFKSNAYEEHSEGYYDSSADKPSSSKNKAGYIAPIFQVPDPREVSFDRRPAPVKYPLAKLAQQKQQTYDYNYNDYNDKTAPLVTEDNVEYDGEDSDRNSQYLVVAHDDPDHYNHYQRDNDHYYHHHEPEKYKYSKGAGKTYKAGHHSEHGEKGDKGFKKYHDFDEEEMGHHGKHGQKGFHKGTSGYHKDGHDDAEKHGQYYRGKHGEKGHKYGETAGHKKGHKTTGYHNIFHKDEYKKEQKFYDDAHKHGYHDKHGAFHAQHLNKHGGKTSAGHHDSAYDDGHKGSSSKFKKGHYDQDHKGHKGESGNESHYNHFSDYDKKGGHSSHEKHGHHEDDHHHGHDHHHHDR